MVCDRQAPLSMGFSQQAYRSGLPFPSPGDLPNPGIEPASPMLQVDSLLLSHRGSPSATARVPFVKCRLCAHHFSCVPRVPSCVFALKPLGFSEGAGPLQGYLLSSLHLENLGPRLAPVFLFL